jgi:hypothetical protein
MLLDMHLALTIGGIRQKLLIFSYKLPTNGEAGAVRWRELGRSPSSEMRGVRGKLLRDLPESALTADQLQQLDARAPGHWRWDGGMEP